MRSQGTLASIKQVAKLLKADFPQKRGVIVRIGCSYQGAYGRQHTGFHVWRGTRRSLREAIAPVLGKRVPQVMLHVTHPAVAFTDPVAKSARADITRLAMKEAP